MKKQNVKEKKTESRRNMLIAYKPKEPWHVSSSPPSLPLNFGITAPSAMRKLNSSACVFEIFMFKEQNGQKYEKNKKMK